MTESLAGPAVELGRARALLGLSRPAEAVAVLARALATDPASVEAWLLLARAELAREEPARALEAAGRGLALAPEHPVAHLVASTALTRLGRHDEAVWAARDVVRLAPQEPQAHARLARALVEQGGRRTREEARRAAQRAVALAPEDAESHAAVGDVALAQRQDRVADQAYRRVLQLSPQHQRARYALGVLALRRGDLPTAAEGFLATAAEDRTGVARASLEVTLWRVLVQLHAVVLLVALGLGRAGPDDGSAASGATRVLAAGAIGITGVWLWSRARRVPAPAWRFLRIAMLRTRPAVLALGALAVAAVALLAGLTVPGAMEPAATAAGLAGAGGLLAARAGGRGVVRRVTSQIQAQAQAQAPGSPPQQPRGQGA